MWIFKIKLSILLFFTLHLSAFERVSLQLESADPVLNAGYYMAYHKGFYRQKGLAVSLKPSSAFKKSVDEVVEGGSDFGVGSFLLPRYAMEGENITALAAVWQNTPRGFVAKKRGFGDSLVALGNHLFSLPLAEYEYYQTLLLLLSRVNNALRYERLQVQKGGDSSTSLDKKVVGSFAWNERLEKKEYTFIDPYRYGVNLYDGYLFTSHDRLKERPKSVQSFLEASLQGWEYVFEHKLETADYLHRRFPNISLEAMKREIEVLEGYAYNNTLKIGSVSQEKLGEIQKLFKRLDVSGDIDMSTFLFEQKKNFFTFKEKSYIDLMPNITLTGLSGCFYKTKEEKKGECVGIPSRYIKKIEEMIPLSFERIKSKNKKEALQKVKQKAFDVIVAEMNAKPLYQNYTPIKPFVTSPVAIIMKKRSSFINSIEDIKYKKIAVIESHVYNTPILEKYKDISFYKVKSMKEGINGIATGKYDALLASLLLSTYTISSLGISNVAVVGKTDFAMNITFFVKRDNPILHSVLDKTVSYIHDKQHFKIINEVIKPQIVQKVDYIELLIYTIPLLLFFLLIGTYVWVIRLKTKNREYQELLSITMESIFIVDRQNKQIVVTNMQAAHMFGYQTKEALVKKEITALFAKKEHEKFSRHFSQPSALYETELIKADGSSFPGIVQGADAVFEGREVRLVAVMDMSDIKKKEKELKASYEAIDEMVDATIEGIAIFKKGKLIHANQAFLEIMRAVNFEAIENERIEGFFSQESIALIETLEHGLKEAVETKLLRLDHDAFWALVRTEMFQVKNEELMYTYVVDINELKEKEAFILQQAKMAAMGEMIGMIAHQWRQPLGAIASSSIGIITKMKLQKMKGKDLSNEELFEFILMKLERINSYSKTLSETIDDFRNFFNPHKKKEQFCVREIADRALSIVEPMLHSKNIEVRVDLASVAIECYKNELLQVFLNLLKNAADALEENEVKKPHISIHTQESDEKIIIHISDNAGGVPEDIIESIFFPYFSTKSQTGTGLGLYMSKVIVEEHCMGKLSVRNTDEGARFSIELQKGEAHEG